MAIAAMSENRSIGNGGQIPWYLPDDFKWFKRKTMGSALLMGRKTFESIGRVLPGRTTIVLSRGDFSCKNVDVYKTVEDIPVFDGEIFVCGGAEIYSLMLPLCSDLFLTRVKRETEGDCFFPEFEEDFQIVKTIQETEEFKIEQYHNNNNNNNNK